MAVPADTFHTLLPAGSSYNTIIMHKIAPAIENVLRNSDGVWGVYLERLDDKEAIYEYNSNASFPAASIAKLPIAIYVFDQINQGNNSLDEMLSLHDDYRLSGSGVLEEMHDGLNLNILDMVKLMLLVSDNTAAKHLVVKFTPKKINQYLKDVGFKTTQLKIDGEKFGYGMTTAKEMAQLMHGIWGNAYFKPELSSELLRILKKSQGDLGIRRYLPHDRYDDNSKLEVASKGGSIPGVRNEVAIVFAKEPYVLSILSKDLSDLSYKPDNAGLLTIAKVSEVVYNALSVSG
jgi:beta-lactamase class A